MGGLKPIMKPFDRRWNYIQHASIKLILFLVIWSLKYGTMLKNKFTILGTSVNRVCDTALSIFPHWISKPYIRKHKNHSKANSGVGRLSRNLGECKNSWFIVRNCKSGQQNQRHTFRRRRLQHKMTLTNIPSTGLKVKSRKKGNTKIPSPRRRIWIMCAINLCQDASLHESTKMKPPLLFFDESTLFNDYILIDTEYIDCFYINFPCHYVLNKFD